MSSRQPKISAKNVFEKLVNEVFRFSDVDTDGKLSPDETVCALRSLGVLVDDSDIKSITKPVTLAEFTSLIETVKKSNKVWSLSAGHMDHLKLLRTAFDAIDVSKKGEVDCKKLHDIFCVMGSPLSESEFASLFQTKSLTFEQFVAVIGQSTVAKSS